MKKILALLLALTLVLALVACGGGNDQKPAQSNPSASGSQPAQSTPAPSGSATEITAWIYPVGGWTSEENVKPLIEQFTADTGIKVNLEWLAYADGDDKVNTAITAKKAPDLIMEGPERLVANWGAKGYLVDLKDLLPAGTYDVTAGSCTNAAGAMYELPVCQTAHCSLPFPCLQ